MSVFASPAGWLANRLDTPPAGKRNGEMGAGQAGLGCCWAVWSWGNGHESVCLFWLTGNVSPPLQRRDELDLDLG